jgi:hypothetical protein
VLNAMVVRVRLSSKHSIGTRRDVLVQVELELWKLRTEGRAKVH